jgi:hypothetical protein
MTQTPEKRWNNKVRYAPIMTLRSHDEDFDLHAEIDSAINLRFAQEIDV